MILDGKALAQTLQADLVSRVDALRLKGVTAGFSVILIGDHAPSAIYVRNKQKAMEKLGIRSTLHHLPETISQKDLLTLIQKLNRDSGTHGILLQLPIPAHLDTTVSVNAISPEKDVDGLSVLNVGKRTLGLPSLLPCTPKGCIKLIKTAQRDLSGLHAVVIGRSDLVGKPMAQLLLRENCTVTQAHSRTTNQIELYRSADILVAAIGQPAAIKGDWIKQGAIVIDVGINRVDDKLIGDVDFAGAVKKAAAITPVPGGVGPMTIACLLENTIEAAENQSRQTTTFK